MNTVSHNRKAWNKQSNSGSRWSQPVDAETILRASEGEWDDDVMLMNKFSSTSIATLGRKLVI